jgi:hypothetical protein
MGNNTTIMTETLEVPTEKEMIVNSVTAPSFQEQLTVAWNLHRAGDIALVSPTGFSKLTQLNIISRIMAGS